MKRGVEQDAHEQNKKQKMDEAARKREELARNIQARMAQLKNKQAESSSSAADQNGTTEMQDLVQRDPVTGQLIMKTNNLPKPQITTKANLRMQQQQLLKEKQKEKELKVDPAAQLHLLHQQHFYDPKIKQPKVKEMGMVRKPKQIFQWFKKGEILEQAEAQRKKEQLEKLKNSVAQKVQESGLETELEFVGDVIDRRPIPDMEWWDTPFFKPNSTYDDPIDEQQVEELITDLIQHPPLIYPPHLSQTKPQTLKLTKKETKKMRRLRRLEEQKEKQEKIRLGLLPPEEPKIKLSNMMRVLGQEAVLDPTQIEQQVRTQMQQRLQKHLQQNEERKLSAEERAKKNFEKYEEDLSQCIHCALFKISELKDPSHLFKIYKNAEQNHLTGICIRNPSCNMVIVEGGPKGIRRYKHLLMERIQWPQSNQCLLVWEGLLKEKTFKGFKNLECQLQPQIKQILGDENYHYWELCKNYQPS